jgi:hypothetical protein
MAISQQGFTENQTITITLASLANNATAVSSTIDNTTTKYVSADIQVKIRTGTSPVSPLNVTLKLLRCVDGGTNFDDSGDNAEILGIFTVTSVTGTDYIFSVDTSNKGILPARWKIAITNNTGVTFDSTSGNFYAKFTGKKFEIV